MTEDKALTAIAEAMHAGPGGGWFYSDLDKARAVIAFLRDNIDVAVALGIGEARLVEAQREVIGELRADFIRVKHIVDQHAAYENPPRQP